MEKVKQYRKIVVELLERYASLPFEGTPKAEEWEDQLLLDTKHDHYQLLSIGWKDMERIYYPIIHLDIKNGKIWVQEDATDFDVVGELEKQGVAKSDIVLAFHAPYKRQYTGYAAA